MAPFIAFISLSHTHTHSNTNAFNTALPNFMSNFHFLDYMFREASTVLKIEGTDRADEPKKIRFYFIFSFFFLLFTAFGVN